jgi:uncharacterized protein YcbX
MHLSEINIYPVKSLKGISLAEARVEERGLQFDRRWMLVDEKHRFLTQRELPAMALIRIGLKDSCVTAAFGGRELEIPLSLNGKGAVDVTIWHDTVPAKIYDDATNDWFSDVLQTTVRLVQMPGQTRRRVDADYAVREGEDTVSFADGYPFLLIGEGSLDDLNSRLEAPLPMNRFRPNFVVSGSEPFAEDMWKRIRIGETIFHVVKPCGRCVITTTDQETGDRDKEPLKTLATFRNQNGKVMFGQNLIAESGGATVRIGDAVEVIEEK